MSDKTPRVSADEWRESLKKPAKKNKFNAHRTVAADGRSFPSKGECALYEKLLFELKIGEISGLHCQHSVDLGDGIRWKVDFGYTTRDGTFSLAEYKGVETAEYRLKLTLYRSRGKAPLTIWKGNPGKLRVHEIVFPQGIPERG